MRRRQFPWARLRALFGPDAASVRQSLVALGLSLLASLVAGLTLGSIKDTLDDLPGLLVLIPAAIGLRGTIFGALGARLGTAIHSGTFRLSARPQTVLGQNVVAAAALTVFASVALGVLAKVVAVGFGLEQSIAVADFVVISLVGGCVSSVIVLVLTVVLAEVSVRRTWDPDNVTAPLVTASGDMVTLPSLYLATFLADEGVLTAVLATLGLLAAVAGLVAGLRTGLQLARRIVRQSVIVIMAAGLLSLVAGYTLDRRMGEFDELPALLSLVPPFLAAAGAIGGILSSRLTSKLHLGLLEPDVIPGRLAREDVRAAYFVGFPVFLGASLVADLSAALVDLPSPGMVDMALVALVGGFLATTFAIGIAYYGAVVSYRVGVDPDNVGIPLVTSSLDLVGSICFVLALAIIGLA